jgi:hypothetical protein
MLHTTASARSAPLHEPGSLRFATDRLPWQRSLRWTRPVRDRRLLVLGGLLALLVTVLELVGFGLGMRPYRMRALPTPPIRVTLIEPASELPPPPPEPEPPIVVRASRVAVAPPDVKTPPPPPPRPEEDSDAMRARIGSGGASAKPQLFNPDGSIRLGDSAVAPATAPENPQEAAKARWAEMQQRGENPLDCKRTRFADAFVPDESVGDKVSRKYLKWVGLADMEAIQRRTEQRAQRAREGCD